MTNATIEQWRPRVVSLFAGIGGFDEGFTRAGAEIVAHVEIDTNCRKLLQSKWPDAVCLDDVRTAGKHNLPECDVVTFGFPCQDLSVAGKRAGLAGGRSGLYYEATRIINELKPAYCLFENVPGLYSSNDGRDFASVLMEMAKLGYNGAWRCFDAEYIGVAQRRRRVFGLFSRLDSGAERCAEILSIREGLRGHPAPSREAGEGTTPILEAGARTGVSTDDPRAGSGIGQAGDPMFTLQAGKQHAVAGTLDGKCCAANRGSQANEAEFIVPAVAGCLAAGAHPGSYNGQDAYNDMLIPAKGADSDTKPGHLLPVAIRTAQTSSNGCGIDESGTSYTMDGSQGQAVAVPVAFEPRFVRTTGGQPTTGPHPCLRSDANSGDGKPCVATAMQVRRLTPTECERLQGFPDGWTEGFSDSTRYKMLGNAVAVPCAEWIARRLIKEQQ